MRETGRWSRLKSLRNNWRRSRDLLIQIASPMPARVKSCLSLATTRIATQIEETMPVEETMNEDGRAEKSAAQGQDQEIEGQKVGSTVMMKEMREETGTVGLIEITEAVTTMTIVRISKNIVIILTIRIVGVIIIRDEGTLEAEEIESILAHQGEAPLVMRRERAEEILKGEAKETEALRSLITMSQCKNLLMLNSLTLICYTFCLI